MLKRPITFENPFTGEQETEEFYFNLNKTDLVRLEVGEKGGLQAMLEAIIATNDAKAVWDKFEEIVLAAYGEKSEDGKSFIKNADIREKFSNTPAFDALLFELISDGDAAGIFINSILPKDVAAAVSAQTEKDELNRRQKQKEQERRDNIGATAALAEAQRQGMEDTADPTKLTTNEE